MRVCIIEGMKAIDAGFVGDKYGKLSAWQDEHTTRLWAATEAEVSAQRTQPIRKPGGGRKALTALNPKLWPTLDRRVVAHTRGDPMNPLRCTNKSTEKIWAGDKLHGQETRTQGWK